MTGHNRRGRDGDRRSRLAGPRKDVAMQGRRDTDANRPRAVRGDDAQVTPQARNAARSPAEQREVRAWLREFWREGFKILAVEPRGKKPTGGYSSNVHFKSWDELVEFLKHHPEANFAAATGRASGFFAVDLDGKEGIDGFRLLQERYGNIPRTVRVRSPHGMHLWFRRYSPIGNSVKRLALGVDVRGDGGYIILPGSIGKDGRRYQFVKGHAMGEVGIADPPEWLKQLLASGRKDAARESDRASADPEPTTSAKYGARALRDECERVRALTEGSRNDGLNKSAFRMSQLVAEGSLNQRDAEVSLLQAARATGLTKEESIVTIASGMSAGIKAPRAATGGGSREESDLEEAERDELAKELAELGALDIDNAKRFHARCRGQLIYTAGGGWFGFDGKRWKRDESGAVLALAVDVARKIRNEVRYKVGESEKQARSKHAARSGSRSAVDAMVHLARPDFTVGDETLDRDKFLLNVDSGTIDLRTGELRPHDPGDLITKLVAIPYDPDAKRPTFIRFIEYVTSGDREFRLYLWRVFGYCLTGDTAEQVFFFLIGPGRSGKSVLANVWRELLGEYGRQADMETFLTKQYGNAIPTDVARLRGARVVVASEANFHRQIDEARIKTMTGGDPLVARFMRQNEFEFTAEFKLILVANDFPRVRQKDDAFWRRVRAIPMNRTVREEQVDPELLEKLRAEYPGILAWAVRGCRSWQEVGLPLPEVVRDGTERWKTFADVVRRFVTDRCVLEPGARVSASRLYDSYRDWCAENKEKPQTPSGLKTKLLELDLNPQHTRDGNVWNGIRLGT